MNQEVLIKIIGLNIKKYREQYNKNNEIMTKEKLSNLTNLSLSYINKLENGNTNKGISIKNLYKIAIVLDVPISKFLENKDD